MSGDELFCLSYASTATEKCSALEIGSILEAAFRNNARLDITGALFFGNNYFLQFLEGSRSHINLLFKHIIQDQRHTNIQVLELKEIGSRSFEDWSMKYVRSPSVIVKIMRETGLKEFNPYLLDAFALGAMAEAFRNHDETQLPSNAFSAHHHETAKLEPKKKYSLDILKIFGRHSST